MYYGILLFFILEYMRPGSFIPGLEALHLNSLVPFSLVLATLVMKGFDNREVLGQPNTLLLGSFLGLIGVSVLTAEVTEFAFDKLTAVTGYVLMYWVIVSHVTDMPKLKGVFKALVFVHVGVVLVSPELLFDPSSRSHALGAGSFLGDGNDFALSVTQAIPLCLFLLFESGKVRTRLFYALALLFLIVIVIATLSRGGTLALVVVGAYFWARSKNKGATALLMCAALFLTLLFAPPAYYERMNSIGDTEEGSARGRLDAWGDAIQMAVRNPALGVGAGHFAVNHGLTAHSIYFLALGELGVPGLFILLVFIAYNLLANGSRASAVRARAPTAENLTQISLLRCTSAALIAYATAGAFLSAIYYPHMYILGGLLVVARRISQTETAGVSPAQAQHGRKEISLHWALRPAPLSGRDPAAARNQQLGPRAPLGPSWQGPKSR